MTSRALTVSVIHFTVIATAIAALLYYKHYRKSANNWQKAHSIYEALEAYLTDSIESDSPTEIIPNLYLGSIKDADPHRLRQLGIRNVINMVAGLRIDPSEHGLHEHVTADGVNRLEIAALDNPFYDLSQHFDVTCDFIDKNLNSNLGGKILVHCQRGISRSAAIVAVYLQRKNNWTTEQTLFYVKGKRHCIQPNEGFIEDLVEDYNVHNPQANN